MDNYIREVIFENKKELYDDLSKLSENIKKVSLKKKPFLVEFSGTGRSGKTTAIELIQDVFIKNGLKVLVVDEEYVKVTKEINHNRNKKMNVDSLKYTNSVIEEKLTIYDSTKAQDYDIIIYDRGINDEFVWLDVFDASGEDIGEYDRRLGEKYIDFLIIMTCSSNTTLKRKYFNSLSVMPTKWTNKETMEKYIKGLEKSKKYFDKHSKKIYNIDTDEKDKITVALTIANKLIDELLETTVRATIIGIKKG